MFRDILERIKNLPAVQETQVQSLGQEAPLENKMATHPSILAWRIPWTEEHDCSSWRQIGFGHKCSNYSTTPPSLFAPCQADLPSTFLLTAVWVSWQS